MSSRKLKFCNSRAWKTGLREEKRRFLMRIQTNCHCQQTVRILLQVFLRVILAILKEYTRRHRFYSSFPSVKRVVNFLALLRILPSFLPHSLILFLLLHNLLRLSWVLTYYYSYLVYDLMIFYSTLTSVSVYYNEGMQLYTHEFMSGRGISLVFNFLR